MNEPTCFRIIPGPICFQAFCCPNAMLAHFMHATGALNYWIALVTSLFCPCCVLFAATECLGTDAKLGIRMPKGIFMHCLEALFCSCCAIAQSNEALDAATGMQIGCCSVSERVHDRFAEPAMVTGYQPMPGPAQALAGYQPNPAQAMYPAPSAPPQ